VTVTYALAGTLLGLLIAAGFGRLYWWWLTRDPDFILWEGVE
jgi:hypothetical protein